MPEITIKIGGRDFEVACEPGEEETLQQAADLLDHEAGTLQASIGRMPEPRMLLMAGLMLADRTVELAKRLQDAEQALERQEADLTATRAHVAREAQTEDGGQVSAREMAAALDIIREAADRAEALVG